MASTRRALLGSLGCPSFLVPYSDASSLSRCFCLLGVGYGRIVARRGARATLLRCAKRCDTCDFSLCNTNKSQPASLAQRTQQ